MIEINLWAEKYFPFIPADRKALLKEVKKDKAGFIKKVIKELENWIIIIVPIINV